MNEPQDQHDTEDEDDTQPCGNCRGGGICGPGDPCHMCGGTGRVDKD